MMVMADGGITPRMSVSIFMETIGVMAVFMVGDSMILGYGTTGVMAVITVTMVGADTITHGLGTIGVGEVVMAMDGITDLDMAITAITIDPTCDMGIGILP